MADNVLETVQKLIQDVIAPDVRELKVRLDSVEKRIDSLEKHIDDRFKGMDDRFRAMEQMNANNFERVLAAINVGKSLGEIAALRETMPLRERVAVLEAERTRAA